MNDDCQLCPYDPMDCHRSSLWFIAVDWSRNSAQCSVDALNNSSINAWIDPSTIFSIGAMRRLIGLNCAIGMFPLAMIRSAANEINVSSIRSKPINMMELGVSAIAGTIIIQMQVTVKLNGSAKWEHGLTTSDHTGP